jgi:hypothetical protein
MTVERVSLGWPFSLFPHARAGSRKAFEKDGRTMVDNPNPGPSEVPNPEPVEAPPESPNEAPVNDPPETPVQDPPERPSTPPTEIPDEQR